jgi:hypothetical protein
MGLIDKVRDSRDSWLVRFEEHRIEEEYDHEYENLNAAKIEEQIKKNCEMFGVFPRKD